MPQNQEKITAVRLKQPDGQYGPQIPVGAKAENIQYDNLYSVKEVLGNVRTNVAPLQQQIDNIQTAAIGDAVDAWMDENATPSTSLVLDSSLTQESQAAQAKAAGKLITVNNQTSASSTKLHFNTTNDVVNVALMEDIPDITGLTNAFNTAIKCVEWTPSIYKGQYINSNTGVLVNDNSSTAKKMARTGLWNGFGYRIAVNLDNVNYEYRVMYYDENGSLSAAAGSNGFLGRSEFASGIQYISSNAILFALSIRRTDGSNMSDAYVAEIAAALSAYAATDITLTQRGIAADAKAIGDAVADLESAIAEFQGTGSASGQIIEIYDALKFKAQSYMIDIMPERRIDGTPSSENIRPFYPWNGVNINLTKNVIIGGTQLRDAIKRGNSSAVIDEQNKTIYYTGKSMENLPVLFENCFKPNTRYTFYITFNSTDGRANLRIHYESSGGGTANVPNHTAGTKAASTYTNERNSTLDRFAGMYASGATTLYYDECYVYEGTRDDTKNVPFQGNYYHSDFPVNVYAGKLNALTGELTAYPHYASYNGETLSGEWVSDRDVYVEGTTPTIGAEVIDLSGEGATTYTINPINVELLSGFNTIWADCGVSTISYVLNNDGDETDIRHYIEQFDYDTALTAFANNYPLDGVVDSFIYFTDPHVLCANGRGDYLTKLLKISGVIGQFYNRTATTFVLCGGDWLEWDDTNREAIFKLNDMSGRMKELFGENFYTAIGNHDSNEQGTTPLTTSAIKNLMLPYQAKTYYSFKATNSRVYVLDTGTDHDKTMTPPIRWEQIAWLAEELKNNDDPHSAICMHIYAASGSATDFGTNLLSLIEAYNGRTSVTLNEITYNFADCTGKVGFILAGHVHSDNIWSMAVPVITSPDTSLKEYPVADIVSVDWTNGTINLVRCNNGNVRTTQIVI